MKLLIILDRVALYFVSFYTFMQILSCLSILILDEMY